MAGRSHSAQTFTTAALNRHTQSTTPTQVPTEDKIHIGMEGMRGKLPVTEVRRAGIRPPLRVPGESGGKPSEGRSAYRMLRGMIFDLDGVIIDSHPLHRLAWRKFLHGVGQAVEESELEFILDGRKRDEILRHFLGELTPTQIAAYGAQKDKILRELRTEMQPFPGIVDFLDVVCQAGLRIALATSASSKRAHGTLEKLGLAGYFEAIVTGDEVATSKPDPTIYRLIAKRLDEPPENLLAFEDAVSGVRSATAAGIRCVGIASVRPSDHAESLRSAGANPVVSDFHSLSLAQLDGGFR